MCYDRYCNQATTRRVLVHLRHCPNVEDQHDNINFGECSACKQNSAFLWAWQLSKHWVMELWSVLLLLSTLAVAVYLSKLLIRAPYRLLRDYYVLWNVAFGGHASRRNISKRLRLHGYVCKPILLDELSVRELYTFASDMIESSITIQQFQKVLLSYKFAIICRERMDGSLRGMCLLDKGTGSHNGQQYIVIKLGLALFKSYYQGGPLLYYVLLYHVIKESLLHPLTPLYIMGKLFSYKSYLSLVNSLQHVYPRHDSSTPSFETELIQEFARQVKTPQEEYDSNNFVLKREMSHLKSHVAPVTEKDLANPHIKYFLECNPNWHKGHCLFFVAKAMWRDIVQVVWKAITRAHRARKNTNTIKKAQSYDRHLSYQCPETTNMANNNYEVDALGNLVLHARSRDIFVPHLNTQDSIIDEYGQVTP